MREGLREIADKPARTRIIFLAQEAEIVAEAEQPLEQLLRIVDAAEQHVGVREPKTAGEERALARRQAVVAAGGVVTQDETIDHQVALDRLDGGANARILR